ncbi:hypothetical protein Tco_1484853 [Tanacetum coccineum]
MSKAGEEICHLSRSIKVFKLDRTGEEFMPHDNDWELSFVCKYVRNGVTPLVQPGNSLSSAPALVLDEECVVERDFSNCAMGRVSPL